MKSVDTIEPLLPLPFPLQVRDNRRPRVCVVIPVYNEEQVLLRTHEELSKVLNALEVDWSLLFINDGSKDGTAAVLEALFQMDSHVSYILLSRNFGHQAALTAGLDHANAEIVISMDGDLQHPPGLIADLIAAWRAGYDIVHTRKLETKGLSRTRSIPTRIAYAIVGRVSQIKIIPSASDYRLLDRQAHQAIRSLRESGRLYGGLTPWIGYCFCVIDSAATERAGGT